MLMEGPVSRSQPFCLETPEGKLWFCHKCPFESQTGFRTRQDVREHRTTGQCVARLTNRRTSSIGSSKEFKKSKFAAEEGARFSTKSKSAREEFCDPDGYELWDDDENNEEISKRNGDNSFEMELSSEEFDHYYEPEPLDPNSKNTSKRIVPTQECPNCHKMVHTNGANFSRHIEACHRNLSVGGGDGTEKFSTHNKQPCPNCGKQVHSNGANFRRHIESCQRSRGGMDWFTKSAASSRRSSIVDDDDIADPLPDHHFMQLTDAIVECMSVRKNAACSVSTLVHELEKQWDKIRKVDGSRYKSDARITVAACLSTHTSLFQKTDSGLYTLTSGASTRACSSRRSSPAPQTSRPGSPFGHLYSPDATTSSTAARASGSAVGEMEQLRQGVDEARRVWGREDSKLVRWEDQLVLLERCLDAFIHDFPHYTRASQVSIEVKDAEEEVRLAERDVLEHQTQLQHLRSRLHAANTRRQRLVEAAPHQNSAAPAAAPALSAPHIDAAPTAIATEDDGWSPSDSAELHIDDSQPPHLSSPSYTNHSVSGTRSRPQEDEMIHKVAAALIHAARHSENTSVAESTHTSNAATSLPPSPPSTSASHKRSEPHTSCMEELALDVKRRRIREAMASPQ